MNPSRAECDADTGFLPKTGRAECGADTGFLPKIGRAGCNVDTGFLPKAGRAARKRMNPSQMVGYRIHFL